MKSQPVFLGLDGAAYLTGASRAMVAVAAQNGHLKPVAHMLSGPTQARRPLFTAQDVIDWAELWLAEHSERKYWPKLEARARTMRLKLIKEGALAP